MCFWPPPSASCSSSFSSQPEGLRFPPPGAAGDTRPENANFCIWPLRFKGGREGDTRRWVGVQEAGTRSTRSQLPHPGTHPLSHTPPMSSQVPLPLSSLPQPLAPPRAGSWFSATRSSPPPPSCGVWIQGESGGLLGLRRGTVQLSQPRLPGDPLPSAAKSRFGEAFPARRFKFSKRCFPFSKARFNPPPSLSLPLCRITR